MTCIQVHDICLTNASKPGGLVEVLYIGWDGYYMKRAAQIRHIEDHPYGYKKGEINWYFVDELIFVRKSDEEG